VRAARPWAGIIAATVAGLVFAEIGMTTPDGSWANGVRPRPPRPMGALVVRFVARSGGPPVGGAAAQTHPRVIPAAGVRHTSFGVVFTLRDQPGHRGVLATDYRVQVDAGACPPPAPAPVTSGVVGSPVRVPLPAPQQGWCPGRHAVTIFLQRGPYCPRPAAGQPPTPCPEFATQEIDVGTAHFTVRRS
jgi:hypothetical protein